VIVPITLPIIDAPAIVAAQFDVLPESCPDFRDGRREYRLHPLHLSQQDGDYLDAKL
jgi:hypothetical protein